MTICTHGRQPLFGDVVDGEMRLSAFGRIANDEWLRTAEVRPPVLLDAFVVMPDHAHLFFGIVPEDADREREDRPGRRGTLPVCPCPEATGRRFGTAVPGAVASIMRQYKSIVTKRVRAIDPTVRLWQRGFHGRVVRTEREADALRRYVIENPARWDPTADRLDGHRR